VTAADATDWPGRLARAREIVAAALPPTPLIESPGLGDGVLLKLESFQPTGAFKVRGALAALSAMEGEGSESGVVTASSGNHALGVAWAAQRLGVPATVVVPTTASPAKLASLRQFPATVVRHGTSYDEAEKHAISLATGGVRYLSASSNRDVIAGQATIGTDLLGQVTGEFTVVCGIGGGAMASGLGLTGRASGRMSVIGVEAAASLAMSSAVRAGQVVPVEVHDSLADGLTGNLEPGTVTVDLIGEYVSRLVSVTEEQIIGAIRYLARAHGLVAVGSGAAPVAAIMSGEIPAAGQFVAVISGRNIAMHTLAQLLPGN
jgi:threonine dehydratase